MSRPRDNVDNVGRRGFASIGNQSSARLGINGRAINLICAEGHGWTSSSGLWLTHSSGDLQLHPLHFHLEPIVMLRFMKCMAYDAEKIKALVELNYSLRNKNPHLFMERSIEDEMTAKCLRASSVPCIITIPTTL